VHTDNGTYGSDIKMRGENYKSARNKRGGKYSKGKGKYKSPVFSALDLGTNNCRLLIATPTRNGFRVIDAFSRIVRLGDGLAKTGVLSDDAKERAVEALTICAQKISRREVTHMRSVATEACRLATNCSDFVDQVWENTGIALDVISPAEEARLAVMGCQSLLSPNIDRAIVFDIGGGSTEVIWVDTTDHRQPKIMGWDSLPFGVVRLSDTYECHNITDGDYLTIFNDVTARLDAFDKIHGISQCIQEGRVQLMGSSGTVTTLASIELGLDGYDRSKVDGSLLLVDNMANLTRRVAFTPFDQRAELSCVGSERADLLVPGCAVFEAILRQWPAQSIRVADRGIREGVLRGLLVNAGFDVDGQNAS
jgi:exopolyphosphatase/guanosine-5'-triphosphate,3'-diphosphate pyrophosphatase